MASGGLLPYNKPLKGSQRWNGKIESARIPCLPWKACIRGTRVMVPVILDDIAAGESHGEIERSYYVEPISA
ncbi:MAG: DUF433 domain-containing protein [Candidatus Hydrogenedentes bacterium]|nr:DUF433 domain-containing protein [Candidatus Hydrogenedentota bacterium]